MVTMTNTGLEYDSKLFCGISTTPFKYIQLGTGSTDESESDTSLESLISDYGLSEQEGTASIESGYTAVISATFTCTSDDKYFRETGLCDADSHLAMRHVFLSDKYLDNGESATITFKIIKGRA